MLFGSIPTEPWDVFLTPSFWWFVIFVVALIVIERVVSWVARRAVVSLNLPKSAANNLIIVVRIVLIVIAITSALPLFGVFIPSELLVAITASLSTAVALFISFSLSNVVAGIYLLATRPFAVGDYVRIGNNEGIVEEISINYTRIFSPDKVFRTLPNQTVLQNDITNYRVRERLYKVETPKKKEKEVIKEEELQTQSKKPGRLRRLFSRGKVDKISDAIKVEKLYKYTFDVAIMFDFYNRSKTENGFEEVCDKWESEFGYKPSFILWKIDWIMLYRFSVTVEKPIKIIEHRNDFQDDLLEVISTGKK